MERFKTRAMRFREARLRLPKNETTLASVYSATGVPSSKIKDLENDDVQRSVGYPDIVKLATHYQVSIDWLIGNAEFIEAKNEHVSAKELGFTEDAIIELQHIKERSADDPAILPILNRLLSHSVLLEILSELSDIQKSVKIRSKYQNKLSSEKTDQSMRWTEGSRLILEATGGQYDVISREDKELIIETKLHKHFQTIIDDVKNVSSIQTIKDN